MLAEQREQVRAIHAREPLSLARVATGAIDQHAQVVGLEVLECRSARIAIPRASRYGATAPPRERNVLRGMISSEIDLAHHRLPELSKSYTVSTGLDLDYDKKNGVRCQYAMVDTREPDQHSRQHYLNLGTTYWIEDSLAIGVRAAVLAQQLSGEAMTTGSRSLFIDARLVLD